MVWRAGAVVLLAAVAVAGVVYTTSGNPQASPHGSAIELRIGIITALIAAGLYAHTSRLQARIGTLLIGAGFFASVWLLNGSGSRLPFTG